MKSRDLFNLYTRKKYNKKNKIKLGITRTVNSAIRLPKKEALNVMNITNPYSQLKIIQIFAIHKISTRVTRAWQPLVSDNH